MAHKGADLFPPFFICSTKAEKVKDGSARKDDYIKLSVLSAAIMRVWTDDEVKPALHKLAVVWSEGHTIRKHCGLRGTLKGNY